MVHWLPAIVIFIYLAVVLYIGIFAFGRSKETGEDFFVASRGIGSIFFFLALFATNMTAFAIIGSSGMAYRVGIGVFGMMATSSAIVIPLTLFFIGTRLWAIGKRFGHMTQVAFFRDRWECSETGTFIFLLTAAMMLPYLIISIIGGGTILESLTDGRIPYALGGAIVALVVMGNVFFGGMRGAVYVNVFQTILFLAFGGIAVAAISHHFSFSETVQRMTAPGNPLGALLERTAAPKTGVPPGVPKLVFLSYMFIPLSSIMFPHMAIMCFTAKKVQAFKKTVVLYPLCIMLIWLPCVFLGTIAAGRPDVTANMAGGSEALKHWVEDPAHYPEPALMADLKKLPAGAIFRQNVLDGKVALNDPEGFAKKLLAIVGPLKAEAKKGESPKAVGARKAEYGTLVRDTRILASSNSDSVLLTLLKLNITPILAGILAAGIISAVMGSDCHQILALSTMFTKDVVQYYGGRERLGEKGTVYVGRSFVILANLIAYSIALFRPQIFELAVQYAFSGFAALAPVMIAALFWKRSTKTGALWASVFVAACVVLMAFLELHFRHPAPHKEIPILGHALFLSAQNQLRVFGMMPVVAMVLGSSILVILGSLISAPPSAATIARYFPDRETGRGGFPLRTGAAAV